MYRLISKEWRYDDKGQPIKRHLDLTSSVKQPLPKDAPIGSRAVCFDGSVQIKTALGWQIKEVGR